VLQGQWGHAGLGAGLAESAHLALALGCQAAYPAALVCNYFLERLLTTATVTESTLAAFSEAWNRHDVEGLMSFMSDDCVFMTAGGPEACGARHVGREAVAKAFAGAWAALPDAHWSNGVHFVQGDFGVSQWTFTGTAADGSRVETDGVDIFTFKDGKIAVKNAFRKARPNLPAAK
jgi:ketosteroid isomerase-like protein